MSDEKGQEPEVKSGGKLLLIVGLIVGLGVGGGGAYFYFGMNADDAVVESDEPEVLPEPEPLDDPQYVEVKRLTGPLISESDGVLGYVFLDVSLEINGMDDRDYVFARRAIVKDAFLKELAAASISREGQPGVLDYDALQARLLRVANESLGENLVRRVLITRAQRQ